MIRPIETSSDTCWLCGAIPTYDNPVGPSCSPGVSICRRCKPDPVPCKLPKHPNASKFDRLYKRFLRGDIWLHIVCVHTAPDGCKALRPLPDRKFYEV